MITYREARAIVVAELKAHSGPRETELVSLESCDGRVLAEDIRADRDYPALDRSARDGFAARSSDLPGRLKVVGEIRAGDSPSSRVDVGEAIEIMTGAPVPPGADSIVMVEHVVRSGEWIEYQKAVEPGQFVNYRGGEVRAGTTVLEAGARIDYTEVALLASLGCVQVKVFTRPRVSIIATGDELVAPDMVAEPHQIRNSNAYSLAAQVRRAGGVPETLPVAPDREAETRALIDRGLEADLLLLSGGVSAGRYDFVEKALQSVGAVFFFDRVAIQPGQPVVFGRVRERFFFGLPGNPASTMVTFEVFARTAVEMLGGQPPREPLFTEAKLARDYRHRGELTRFLPAYLEPNGELTPITWTGSSDVASLTRANVFMVVDPERTEWRAGDRIELMNK